MSQISGNTAEYIRNFLNGKLAIEKVSILPAVTPVLDVEAFVKDYVVRTVDISITANGLKDVTQVLNSLDAELLQGYAVLASGTFELQNYGVIVRDNTLANYHYVPKARISATQYGLDGAVCPIVIPAGWRLGITIENLTVAGTLRFTGLYRYWTAKKEKAR